MFRQHFEVLVIGQISRGCPQNPILDEEFDVFSRFYLCALASLLDLMNSKEKMFDEKGMKAYKSLKRISSLLTPYIQNVWAGEPQEQDDAVVIRCHCFSSLKPKNCI